MPKPKPFARAQRVGRQVATGAEVPVSLDDLTFGEAAYRIRSARGIAQATLAARAGISGGYFSELENGKRRAPPLATARRIASVLGRTDAEKDRLIAIAVTERAAALHDSDLPPAVRGLVANIRAAAPHLSAELVARLHATLEEARM